MVGNPCVDSYRPHTGIVDEERGKERERGAMDGAREFRDEGTSASAEAWHEAGEFPHRTAGTALGRWACGSSCSLATEPPSNSSRAEPPPNHSNTNRQPMLRAFTSTPTAVPVRVYNRGRGVARR